MLSPIDDAILLIYVLLLVTIGFIASRQDRDEKRDYMLDGRRLTLPAFVMTLVTTWYGGILGVGEFSYLYGISSWLVFGVPYYIAALIFAFFIAKRARREQLVTIPEQLERQYGRPAGMIGAFFVFILTLPAAYLLMLGILMQFLLGWSLVWCVVLGSLFSMAYVLAGGFRAIIRTDALQFTLMFLGFILISGIAFARYGGLEFLKSNVPASHFVWHGGQGPAYIIVWLFIALATLVEPSFYQRCFAAKNEKTASRGMVISVLFWIVFDFLTTFTGLYARALLPDLSNPLSSYLALGEHLLPPVLLGLFCTGLLATIMSSVDSYVFLSAMTLGRDVFGRFYRQTREATLWTYTRWGLLISAILSISIALAAQSVIVIWKQVGSLATPALLVPLVSSFSKKWKMSAAWVPWTMMSASLLSGVWILSGWPEGPYLLGIEPIYPGLGLSFSLYILSHCISK